EVRRSRNAGVMRAERAQLVRIGCGDKSLAITRRDFAGGTVAIEPAFVEMTYLDRIEAVDVFDQSLTADRSANDEERMRRESENGIAALRPQPPHVVEVREWLGFVRAHI